MMIKVNAQEPLHLLFKSSEDPHLLILVYKLRLKHNCFNRTLFLMIKHIVDIIRSMAQNLNPKSQVNSK